MSRLGQIFTKWHRRQVPLGASSEIAVTSLLQACCRPCTSNRTSQSIEFHERGKNHKENVTKKISEIKQKSVAKAKDEERKSKEFAAMEEAALKAYEEDLKRLEGTKPVPAAPVGPTIEERRARDEKKRNEIEALEKHHAEKKWKKGMSPEGYPYYYNLTGESSWEKPKGFLETTDHAEGQGTSSVWVESVSEEGYTYYYNSDTGESRWDKPEDLDSNLPPSDEKKDIAATEDNSVDSEKEIVTSELETKTTPEETEPADGATQSPTVTLKTKSNFRSNKETNSDSDHLSDSDHKEEDMEAKYVSPEPAIKKKAKKSNPYGAWEEIRDEEDPYEHVDLELPNMDSDDPAVLVPDLPQEPKVKFKEKTITSLGDTVVGASVFKKRKLDNGRSRNIRPRLNDH
ncbi:WW domain-binding protein 4 isoform X2 [Pseudophryne corroboree]|uniref:WW domain-binding protein 4 isoform X2 n=1 Tax=Pseudophryne corroboree TaxID=495146 RepID=UPI003081CD98